MRFNLTDYKIQRDSFQSAVQALLTAEADYLKKTKVEVEDLSERRRDQVLFLQTVIEQIDARLQKDGESSSNLKDAAKVFAGALLVIKQDVYNNSLTASAADNSLLHQWIDKILAIKEGESEPDNYQISEYLKAFNDFLTIIYKNNDSREGLAEENVFYKINFKKIVGFAALSNNLECENFQKIVSHFSKPIAKTANGHTNKHSFRTRSVVTQSTLMTSENYGFVDIHKQLKKDIDAVCAIQKKARVEDYPNANTARQMNFLLILSAHLEKPASLQKDANTEATRIAILAGALLHIREEIGVLRYKYGFLSLTPVKTSLHTKLSELLDIKNLCVEDAAVFVQIFQEYLQYLTLEKIEIKDKPKAEALAGKHIFSELKGFELGKTLEFSQEFIKYCRNNALTRCVQEDKAQHTSDKQSILSYVTLGFLGGASKASGRGTGPHENKRGSTESKEENSRERENSL